MRVESPRSTVWHRALPLAEMLAEAARFEELLGAQDDLPVCIGALRDGHNIDAPSLTQLHADLQAVPDEDVVHLSIGIGGPSTQIWLSREPDFSSDSRVITRLRVVGDDDAQADSVFARVSHELEERLSAVEETERREAAARERELAAARQEAIEAAARSKPDTRFGRLAARATVRTQSEPATWELWAVGIGAALAAVLVLLVATMLIH
jgi:hypothetical protein